MDKLDKDIEKIKVSRMKPYEKFLYNVYSNLIVITNEKYPDYIFYKLNEKLYAKYNIKYKTFYYNQIMFSLSYEKYKIHDYMKIINSIKDYTEKYLHIKLSAAYFIKNVTYDDNIEL